MRTRELEDAAPSSRGAVRLLAVSAAMGLLAGFLEAAYRVGWHQTVRHGAAARSLHALWMAPLTEFVICAALGGVLALLAAADPRRFTARVTLSVLAFAAWFAVTRAVPPLDWYARLLLAGGLSAVTTRWLVARSPRTVAIAWCAVGLLALAVVCGVGITAWEINGERRGLAALRPARPGSPNVLLITLDTVRARSLSLYGYERRTSASLERLASTGVVFDRALATASWTLPSHASLFTGRYPHELDGSWLNPVHLPDPTLASTLEEHGYETAGFVANLVYCNRENGLARGMLHYEDRPVTPGTMLVQASLGRLLIDNVWLRRAFHDDEVPGRKTAERLNADFLSWQSARGHEHPFFAFLNYLDAHEPLLPRSPYDALYGPTHPGGQFDYNGFDIGHTDQDTWSAEDAAKNRNAYDSSITYLDHEVGALFAELERRRLLDNTLVIVTADHGESLGEHGLFGHGQSLYLETLHVPLLVSLPGRIPAGVRVRETVSLRDLPATIAGVLGLEPANTFPGASLEACWMADGRTDCAQPARSDLPGAPFFDARVPTSRGDMTSLVTDRYQYIRSGDGREELYDLSSDLAEARNLSDTSAGRAVLMALRPTPATLTTRGERRSSGSRNSR